MCIRDRPERAQEPGDCSVQNRDHRRRGPGRGIRHSLVRSDVIDHWALLDRPTQEGLTFESKMCTTHASQRFIEARGSDHFRFGECRRTSIAYTAYAAVSYTHLT